MKNEKNEIAMTASSFASAVGIDRNALSKRLSDQRAVATGTKNGGKLYSLRTLYAAGTGGDPVAERLRKLRAEADLLEISIGTKRRELVPVESVVRLGQTLLIAARQVIERSPLDHADQDRVLAELHALGESGTWNQAV